MYHLSRLVKGHYFTMIIELGSELTHSRAWGPTPSVGVHMHGQVSMCVITRLSDAVIGRSKYYPEHHAFTFFWHVF